MRAPDMLKTGPRGCEETGLPLITTLRKPRSTSNSTAARELASSPAERRLKVVSSRAAAEDAIARFEALPELTWKTFSWLLGKGVPSAALIFPETLRRARVMFHHDQPFFDFAEDHGEDGEDAIVILARDDEGFPCDLAAWGCRSRRLAARWGAASLLGAEDILAPRLTPEAALPVHRTPLGWLASGRAGVVIIEARRAAIVLRDFGPLAGEDEEHGHSLRSLFRHNEPHIYVPERSAA
jgi:hypothetical protein